MERKEWEIEGKTCSKGPSRIRAWVTAIRTEPIWYALYPVSYRGAPSTTILNLIQATTGSQWRSRKMGGSHGMGEFKPVEHEATVTRVKCFWLEPLESRS